MSLLGSGLDPDSVRSVLDGMTQGQSVMLVIERPGGWLQMAAHTLTYRGTVYPWHCDQMGHMNVMGYVGKFDEATWQLFAAAGITPSYLRGQRRGMIAVDQRLSYRGEHVATSMLKGVHIDTVARRSCPLPEELRATAAKFVVADPSPWESWPPSRMFTG